MEIYGVIMAGGSGTRFWPKSVKSHPKQFHSLFGEKTMIQQTVARLEGLIPPENVMVVTNSDYAKLVSEQLPKTKAENIIGETVAKNTAPCVAAAAAMLNKANPDSVMVVLPADHEIKQPGEFKNLLKTAIQTATKYHSLVTVGIEPNRPETGYGYIRFDKKSEEKVEGRPVYSVRNFTEKPDLETAETFIKSGDYLWNSGMFIWKTSVILDQFKKHLPGIYKHAEKLMQQGAGQKETDAFYEACPSVSIDYGIMEKAEKVDVVPGSFGWNDVGSWTSVYELSDKDEHGNVTSGETVVLQDSKQNLVQTTSKKLVALAGVENIAVVETETSILIVNLNKAQGVKQVVEELKKEESLNKYL